jgi:hypothetical protein
MAGVALALKLDLESDNKDGAPTPNAVIIH